MQTAASRRAFSFLASKIHPQLPLSPRESQQLLALLTTSFRAQLDRKHPVSSAQNDSTPHTAAPSSSPDKHYASPPGPSRVTSSHASASQHIESILTNPLFSVIPQRRASEPTNLNAQTVLRDPLSWFLDQVASGAADLQKASTCLQMLERNRSDRKGKPSHILYHWKRPASQITSWLTSSGIETTKEFLDWSKHQVFIKPLVNLLLKEGEEEPLWRWFTRDYQLRFRETGLDPEILHFRRRLLWNMVTSKAWGEPTLDEAISVFLKAVSMLDTPGYNFTTRALRPAGYQLVSYLLERPQSASPALYESFLQSSEIWAIYSRRVRALLWLHHPVKPSTLTAVAYLTDPNGAAAEIPSATPKGRRELVQLCLGTVHRLLVEQNFSDAQRVLELARANFPDLVGTTSIEPGSGHDRARNVALSEEERNLEMLDRLLPT